MSDESLASSPSSFRLRTQAALDNISNDDEPLPLPEVARSRTPFDLQSRILAALENMSKESRAPSPSSFQIRIQAALDNISDDNEQHPPTAGTLAGTLLDVPASCPDISLALIQAALDNMSEDDGSPPHPPSTANNAGTTHNVPMMSDDDEDPPCHNPYPYSLLPHLSDGLADAQPRKRVRRKKVYQPEDFEDMDDAWFE